MVRTSRLAVAAALLIALCVPTAALGQSTGQAQSSDPRFFSQTNFRIDNDAFWDFFQQRGGVRRSATPCRAVQARRLPGADLPAQVMQLQADGGVQTLNLLDAGLMPYTKINGSTFPAPIPPSLAATPTVSDPDYAAECSPSSSTSAPDTFDGQPVNFGTDLFNTVSQDDRRLRIRVAAAWLRPRDLGRADQPASRTIRTTTTSSISASSAASCTTTTAAAARRACCWPTI